MTVLRLIDLIEDVKLETAGDIYDRVLRYLDDCQKRPSKGVQWNGLRKGFELNVGAAASRPEMNNLDLIFREKYPEEVKRETEQDRETRAMLRYSGTTGFMMIEIYTKVDYRFPGNFANVLRNFRSLFIHEFTHYQDLMSAHRGGLTDVTKMSASERSEKDEYNSPLEYNAYVSMLIDEILQVFNDPRTSIMAKRQLVSPSFGQFMDTTVRHYIHPRFAAHLRDSTARHVIKRLNALHSMLVTKLYAPNKGPKPLPR